MRQVPRLFVSMLVFEVNSCLHSETESYIRSWCVTMRMKYPAVVWPLSRPQADSGARSLLPHNRLSSHMKFLSSAVLSVEVNKPASLQKSPAAVTCVKFV